MSRSWRERGRAAGDHTEAGFTLVEVLISVTLLAMIMGALTAAFITSIKLASDTTQHTKESNDAQLIAAFLVRDAQAAGATNAITGVPDASYGISLTDVAGCTVPSGDTTVVRFEWLDRQSAAPTQSYKDIAVYYYVPASVGKSGQLVRQTCGGPPNFPSEMPLAKNIPTPPSATCDPTPDCSGSPVSVSLTVSEVQTTKPYTITASTRPEAQSAATPNATGAPAPLALLGGGNCSGTAPLSGTGNVPLKVFGNAFIEGGASSCDAYAVDNYTITGHTEAIDPAKCPGSAADCTDVAGISARDPYASAIAASTLKPPPPGPSRSGCSGPGHYASGISITSGTCTLTTGTYYVEGGFNVAAGAAVNTDGGDVLIYLASGTFSIDGKFSASALSVPDYDGFVLWQAGDDTNPLKAGSASNVHLNGVVYAPGADFDAARRVAMKSFVGKALNLAGAPANDPSYDVSQVGLITPSETTMNYSTLDQAANETIQITGSNFVHGASVAFSGDGITVNSTTVVSSNRLDVSVSISDTATVGNRDVIITNPDTGVDIEDSAFTVELRPTITSVTLANGVGTPGVIEAGDAIAIQFSKQMRETSICSLWTGGDNANPTINADGDVTVVATNGAPGNDRITISSKDDCNGVGTNVSLGTIDLGGPGYVTAPQEVFAGGAATLTVPSTVNWNAATRTLTITLGTEAPAPAPPPAPQPLPAAPSAPTYTVPDRFTDNRGANGGLVTPPTFTITPPAIQF